MNTKLIVGCILSSFLLVGATQECLADYATEVLADNPLVYLRFEDGAGSTTVANSGSLGASLNGSLVNGVSLSDPGPLTGDASNHAANVSIDSGAVQLDNVITVEDFGGAGATSFTSYSVEFWYRSLTSLPANNSLVAGTTATGDAHGIYATTNAGYTHRFLHRAPPGTAAGENINPSDQAGNRYQWHHVVLVNDNRAMQLYLDGNLDAVTNTASADFDFDMSFNFGHLAAALPQRFFAGLFDEVAIYNYALDSTRINAHLGQAPAQSPIVPAGPEGQVRIDYGQDGQFVQQGFVAESMASNSDGPLAYTTSVPNTLGGGGTIDVTVEELTGTGVAGLESRNRNESKGPVAEDLVNDFFATRDGQLRVTVSGLPTGNYAFTSWHNDGTASGFASSPNTFDVSVDGTPVGSVVPTDVFGVNAGQGIATSNFQFAATAGSDVVIDFVSRDDLNPGVGFFPINGLTIRVPEPGAVALLAVSLAVAIAGVPRRSKPACGMGSKQR